MRVTIVGDTAATGNSRSPILTMKLQNQDFFLLVPAMFVPATVFFNMLRYRQVTLMKRNFQLNLIQRWSSFGLSSSADGDGTRIQHDLGD